MSKILYLLLCCSLLLSIGCKSYSGTLKVKSEEELAEMEKLSSEANLAFLNENYQGAENTLRGLIKEQTVSRPLYQMELLSVLIMNGKHQEAHELMEDIHQDLELLFDDEMAEKALSVWSGEVNKVYKGDAYERSTFYLFMALSFMRQGKYDEAVGCVKNGLLADADSRMENATKDYAMLYYVGFLASMKAGKTKDADEYLKWMIEALEIRRDMPEAEEAMLRDKFIADFAGEQPNVLLVLWAGTPPTVQGVGEYKEIRAIVRGSNPFDLISLSVNGARPVYPGTLLGDIDYQASFVGGRLMDNVLADKAAAKKAMETTRNIFFIAGTGCLAAAGYMSDPYSMLILGGSGLGCFVLGTGVHIIGYMMNPAADTRYWKNLPGQLYLIPLHLKPGEYNLMFAGYKKSDLTGMLIDKITVESDSGMQVFHLPMMVQGMDRKSAFLAKFKSEVSKVEAKAKNSRMEKELK